MPKSIKAIRESEKAWNRPINAPYSLKIELQRDYPHSGCLDVEWDEWDREVELVLGWGKYGWPSNDQEIQASRDRIWGDLKVLNRFKTVFAPIRLYCPQSCGETLDATMLLDWASIDFAVPVEDLDELTIYEFTRLILLLLRWNRNQGEDRAWVRSEAERMRHARSRLYLIAGSKATLKALERFTRPRTETAPELRPVVASRSQINKALGRCGTHSYYLEAQQALGELKFEKREGGPGKRPLFAVTMTDPAAHQQLSIEIARSKGRTPPGSSV